ncbi:MAG: hypothetical protein WC733_02120 [Methylophilus sp.]|jgi:hypothetical protein
MMTKFIINSPDGQSYEVNAPEGATEQDAISYVQNNLHSQPKKVTDGMSTTQRTLAGIGKGMTDIVRGAGQGLGEATVKDDFLRRVQPKGESYNYGLPTKNDIELSRKLDEDLMNTTAGKVGDFIGQTSMIAPMSLIPGANTYTGAGMIGAIAGAMQPISKDESRLQNAGIGAAGGLIGQYIGNKVAGILGGKPYAKIKSNNSKAIASANVSGEANAVASGGGSGYGSVGDDISAGLNIPKQEILKTGRDLGFKVTPAQASGSRSLAQMEAKLESQPMTSGTFNAIKNNNSTILNRIAAKSIGENSDTVDSAVLQQAQQRIGNIYKIVADDKPRTINPDDFLNKLSSIENEFEGLANISDNSLVKKFINQASSGQATGKQLQDLASKMGKVATNEMTSANGDRQLGMAMYQVKDHVDELLQQGLSGETAKKFSNARGQYRNLMLLTQRAGVLNPSSGDINGNALASLLQQKDKAGFVFNKNTSDLYNAARFSQAFKPLFGDSGTATRSMVTSPTDFVLSLPFKVATKAYASSPVINASVGVGNAMQRGVLNPNALKYLPQEFGLAGGLLGANSN